jgi:hypothetical protein
MFDFICYKPMDSYVPKKEDPPPPSFLRLLNVSEGFKAVDISLNGRMVAKKFSYKKFTPYYPLPFGHYTADIYKSGNSDKPNSTLDINLLEGHIYTLVVEGDCADRILLVHDIRTDRDNDIPNIRFINVSSDMSSINISSSDKVYHYENLSYRSIPNYTEITSGKHTFQISQKEKPVSTIPNVDLKPGWNYTIYIAGSSVKSHIYGITLIDGSTYIKEKDDTTLS